MSAALVRYLDRRGTMLDHWVIAWLWPVDENWIAVLVREWNRSIPMPAIIHRRVWQSAWIDPQYLDPEFVQIDARG